MSCSVKYDVEDVVSAEQNVAVVGEHLLVFVFGCAFKQDVHVSVDFDHLALVFAAVLEDDFDVSVQLLDENVEWFFAGFHSSAVFNKVGVHTHKATCEL